MGEIGFRIQVRLVLWWMLRTGRVKRSRCAETGEWLYRDAQDV